MLTLLLAIVAVVLAVTLGLVFVGQKRLARRLVTAGRRLSDDLEPIGSGLAEATSVVERAVDRALLWGGEGSMVEARLTSALAMIPQGVVVFDHHSSIAYRNEVAAGYLAARHGDALVEEAIVGLADLATANREVMPARTIDLFGPPRRTLVLTAIPLHDAGRRLGVLVVVDDITDRRRLEAVRRDFVANISHELKTPVGALALLAETLLVEEDPAVAQRLAERMLAEAFRVGRTIDDLLELSRIEADEEARRDDVPVHLVIAEAVDRVRPAAEQQGITIEVDEPPRRLVLSGDRRQLVSATYNLLENGVKYSDHGSSVEVRARTDGRWVDIEVEDHGIGIPRRDLERVFERFYRVDRARSRETGGTGLGLAIVRHVAGNHAGDVRVESVEGEGSTFTLRLPVGAGPVRSHQRQVDESMSSPDITVLVVEDEHSFVEALTVGLKREGFAVQVATDGAEALDVFDAVRPDLVLLDVMLPKISGIDVCREIRRRSSVPIIMVTAKGGEIDTVVGLEVGADDYVTKPYRLRELVARMRAVLRRRANEAGTYELNGEAFQVGDVALDPQRHEVTIRGDVVSLPLKEFELLELLLANAGHVLPRETLIDRVWGSDYVGDTKTLDVHVKRLRAKVEPDPSTPTRIVTIRGLGYKYDVPRG